MATLSFRSAIHDAMVEAMLADPRVFLMGEDVGRYGGCYAVSKGMFDQFGAERVIDTPLAESGFVGAGIGAAIGGMRPIVEVMTVNFSLLALDQIVNNAATLRHMSGGQISVPIVIRMACGAGKQLAAQHSHSFEGWYAHIPGLKVIYPGTVADARYMLQMAIADPDPVIMFEHVMLYNQEETLCESDTIAPMEQAVVRRDGHDLTIITWGANLAKSMGAAEQLADVGIDALVLDLRCLRPLDVDALLAAVTKTHKVLIVDESWKSGGMAAEISALIGEQGFWSLDAPITRVCSAEVPIPYPAHLEMAALPQVSAIVAAARQLVA
ncbi:alpha-ketoacid dehydrogenase subunit beta [Corallincola luteus]|uniref:Alpha-ketoacid dehydrogenase subunit beta n=1 Tax=Corallincola luteus TaxID=1775177 RepID=A0ABY2AJ63_9GAMM|nr:alpha-ketoacid dehydrogenase subunit beta [Corallincola luteus]TCI01995.1 alpha-ketoacid dehydrogenase subunit beta [Corallincola luteus]